MSTLAAAVLGDEPADEAFERFCRAELGSGIRDVLFERAGTGLVRGLELEDGRHVVVKAHQPEQDAQFLAAARDVQAFLHAQEAIRPHSRSPARRRSAAGSGSGSGSGSRRSCGSRARPPTRTAPRSAGRSPAPSQVSSS
ncbi:MAG TPA: hypothetical protein VNI55_10340 [Gaiellaceae bacterium]|nr:hypothetical protein [Gaiellaceae bacterium]